MSGTLREELPKNENKRMATARSDAIPCAKTRATPRKVTCETAARDREGLRGAYLRPRYKFFSHRELVFNPFRDSKHAQADRTLLAWAQERRKHPSSTSPCETARTSIGFRRLHHPPSQ